MLHPRDAWVRPLRKLPFPSAAGRAPATAAAALTGLVASFALGYLALSQRLPAPAPVAGSIGDPPALAPCVMDRDGYWQGQLVGNDTLDLDWRGAALACAGNERPNGRGLRLFFAGEPAPGGDRLLLVLGLDSSLDALAGREHAVSLTLVDEASSQFFHSPRDRCFTRVGEVTPLDGSPGEYRVDGELYCVGAVAALSGEAAVTIGDTRYSGRLSLGEE